MKHSKKYALTKAAARSKQPKLLSDTGSARPGVNITKCDAAYVRKCGAAADPQNDIGSTKRRSGSTGTNPNPHTGPSKFIQNPSPALQKNRGSLKIYAGAQEVRIVKSGLVSQNGGPKHYVAKLSKEGEMHVQRFRSQKHSGKRITAGREFAVKKGK